MEDKLIKALAIAIVSVVSAALVAYLKDPENRATLQLKYMRTKKELKKQNKALQKKANKLLAQYQKG